MKGLMYSQSSLQQIAIPRAKGFCACAWCGSVAIVSEGLVPSYYVPLEDTFDSQNQVNTSLVSFCL